MGVAADISMYAFIQNVVIYVSVVVLLFDHCLTFSSEIEHIWNKGKTPFSCLFLINRYFSLSAMLAYVALYLVPVGGCQYMDMFDSNPRGVTFFSYCGGVTPLLFVFSVVTVLVAEAMITLRAYAVYHNSRPVLLILLSVWIVHFSLLIWIYTKSDLAVTLQGQTRGRVLIESKGILFVAPAVVFDTIAGGILTLGLYQRSKPYQVRMPLTRLVIRDGLLYFAVVFVTNVIWVVAHTLRQEGDPILLPDFIPIEILSGCITTTMISRLTLNLRMYDPTASDELTFQTMSLRFQHIRQHTTTSSRDEGGVE